MKKITMVLILALTAGCSTPEQKEAWKMAAVGAAAGVLLLAIVKGGGAGGGGGGGNTVSSYVADYDWDWDLFFNQGSYVWACRGVQSGQFAEQSHCAYKPKVDRWPDN